MSNMSMLLSSPSYSVAPKAPIPTFSFHPLLNNGFTQGAKKLKSLGDTLVGGRASKLNTLGSISSPCYGAVFMGNEKMGLALRGRKVVCAAAASPVFSPSTLHWISIVASLVLMFSKGTPIQKSFLPALFALQAPSSVISWIKSEYGMWTAFLALLVRLFYNIPGEIELPFLSMLLTLVAPGQTTNLRGTPAGAIVTLVIAGYLAYQHFSKQGSLEASFDQGSIVPTLALICGVAIPGLLLFMF